MKDWHYTTFFVTCYIFIFQFPYVFRKLSAVNVLFVVEVFCVVFEMIFKCSFYNIEIFLIWFTGFLSDTTALYKMFAVKHLLSSGNSSGDSPLFSTIASMFIRGWLNNSSIMGSNNWAYISTATATQFNCIFINDFGRFMMFLEMKVDQWKTSYQH